MNVLWLEKAKYFRTRTQVTPSLCPSHPVFLQISDLAKCSHPSDLGREGTFPWKSQHIKFSSFIRVFKQSRKSGQNALRGSSDVQRYIFFKSKDQFVFSLKEGVKSLSGNVTYSENGILSFQILTLSKSLLLQKCLIPSWGFHSVSLPASWKIRSSVKLPETLGH